MEHSTLFILLACTFGIAMTWGVGANDLANVMSTSLGSKAITVRNAMIIAVVFEFAGAYLGGDHVTETLRTGIINIDSLSNSPELIIYGMLSVLLAGSTWMLFASAMGLPVSITNAIVGSIVGFGTVILGMHAIHWHQVEIIVITWITSPTLAGIMAFLIFVSIQRLIFIAPDPVANAKKFMPIYLFLVGSLLAAITILNGLTHMGLHIKALQKIEIIFTTGFLVVLIGSLYTRKLTEQIEANRRERFERVERMFAILMGFTSCAMVFAHGSNDVAIAVGPMALVMSLTQHTQNALSVNSFPSWIMLLGASGVVLGLFMYGRKVIKTVGTGITALTPSRAFAATAAAASTIVVATSTGIPVSATQTLVGSVLGVGLARGIDALNLRVIRNIFMSWVITLPAASLLAIIYFYCFRYIFTHF